jgi:hypothetical protein
MDPLFPPLPEDLSSLSDEELQSSIDDHLSAQRLIRENNAEFLGDLSTTAIVEQATAGKAALAALRAEQTARIEQEQNYEATIAELTSEAAEGEEEAEAAEEPTEEELAAAAASEEEAAEELAAIEEPAAEEPIVASAPVLRRPPAPARERQGRQPEDESAPTLVASAAVGHIRTGAEIDAHDLTDMMIEQARRLGRPKKSAMGAEERYMLAAAAYRFPESRRLTSDLDANAQKIRSLVNTEGRSLVASGGICAPATNIYTIPQFSTASRPVRDALPSFNADRGAVNVPVPTTLASAADAITIITEAEDALGGTFATKSCLDQDCLSYTETAVTIISHCREYGNLNARSWPESITFENELTMAEHARVAEGYLLDRIKAQSIQVTQADIYSTTYDFILAAAKAVAGIRYRLRTGPNFRFRALFPEWVREQVVVDIAATQFDRFVGLDKFSQIMRNVGVEPSFYLDNVSTGTSQAWADEVTSSTLDPFPTAVQWALFPEGAFIHVDGGSLELGLVRDSTLNSTNDFQFFGETFENVALLAPAQAALWITSTVCPSGEFPALTTAASCPV